MLRGYQQNFTFRFLIPFCNSEDKTSVTPGGQGERAKAEPDLGYTWLRALKSHVEIWNLGKKI